MKRLLLSALIFVASSFGAVQCAEAQLPWQLPRTTATGDSSIVVCSDTLKTHTYACTRAQIISGAHIILADTVVLGARDSVTLGSTKIRVGKRVILVGNDTLLGQLNLHDTLSCVSGCVIIGQPTWGSNQPITLSTVAQPNITSVGTLTSLTVSGTTTKGRDSIVAGKALVFPGTDTIIGQPAWKNLPQHLLADSATFADSATGAVRAATLTTARTIGGVSFNGSANTTVSTATGGFTVSGGSLTHGRDSITAGTALTFTAGNDSILGQPAYGTLQQHLKADSASLADSANVVRTTVDSLVTGSTQPAKDSSAKIATTRYVDKAVYANAIVYPLTATDGSAAVPSYKFANASDTVGIYRVGTDTLGFSTQGVRGFSMSGGATATLIGGAGNGAIVAGTGNSRTLTLKTTTSAGTAKNVVVLGADSSTTLLGGLTFNSSSTSIRRGVGNGDSLVFHAQSADKMAYGGGALGFAGNVSLLAGAFGTATSGFQLSCYLNGTGFIVCLRLGAYADTFNLWNSKAIVVDTSQTISGLAGNMTIQAGTGNSRTMTLKTTTSGGTATTFLTGNADQSTTLASTLKTNDGTAALPSHTFTSDTTVGLYKFGTDTLGIATLGVASLGIRGGASATIFGAGTALTVQAGNGNSSVLTLGATSSTGVAANVARAQYTQSGSAQPYSQFFVTQNSGRILALGPTSDSQANDSVPAIGVGATSLAGTPGISGFIDTLVLHSTGTRSLSIYGGAAATVSGGAGSLTIQAGTGNSRRFVGKTTTSGGTATTFLRANELQQSLFADGAVGTPGIGFAADTILGFYRVGTAGASDTLMVAANGVVQMKIAPSGVLRLPALPTEGSTKNAVCWDGTTFNVTQNAAATCTVSAARFKTDIRFVPRATASHMVDRLRATSYREKDGGRLAFGIIADSAAVIDRRLASYDSKGLVTSTNYEEVTTLLVAKTQAQDEEIATLRNELQAAAHTVELLEVRVLRLEQPCGISGHAPWCEQPSAPDTRLIGYKPAPARDQQATIDALRALVCSEKANRRKKVCLH